MGVVDCRCNPKKQILMAKITEGILGGFSGRLGPVVGYRWNGRWCMRSRPVEVRNPRTAAQQAHRMLFRDEVRLAARMAWPVRQALRCAARDCGMTADNLFVRMNQPAFAQVDGVLQVDWQQLRLSTGPMAPVAPTEGRVDEGNVLTVSFERNPLRMRARSDDQVWLYVYCPELEAGTLASAVLRRSGRVRLLLPDGFAERTLWVYAYASDGQGHYSESCAMQVRPEAEAEAVATALVADDDAGAEGDGLDRVDQCGVVGAAYTDVIVGPPV